VDLTLWWALGPAAIVIIYLLTGGRDRRRTDAVDQWRRFTPVLEEAEPIAREGSYRDAPADDNAVIAKLKKRPSDVKKIRSLPGPLARLIEATGGGSPVGHFELWPKIAYLSVMDANATGGSDHQTVVAMLDEAAPAFTVRPLPILDGAKTANTGVQFKKDPEFMDLFLVEPGVEGDPLSVRSFAAEKKIRAWLSRPIREALRDLPDAWLRVQGKTMALTLYGSVDVDQLYALVNTADLLFAEYGADGGPSLLGEIDDEDDEPEIAPPPKKTKAKAKSSTPKAAAS